MLYLCMRVRRCVLLAPCHESTTRCVYCVCVLPSCFRTVVLAPKKMCCGINDPEYCILWFLCMQTIFLAQRILFLRFYVSQPGISHSKKNTKNFSLIVDDSWRTSGKQTHKLAQQSRQARVQSLQCLCLIRVNIL